jgi:hypothetical protein
VFYWMIISTDGNARQYLMEVSFYKVKRTLHFTDIYIKYIKQNYEII